ncbi:hypothetical protein GCM10011571_35580 [Marinithermofilum abyssi]|uniref:Uncharacterized protein n=2 Tax=Marinithermofilum abyssi TaxID=1571185 RepID=A0A8J2YCB2_9BACL|nr:hypothetical protein GCM10011571_35580 [Marinithermofilum abyssi]
MGKQAFARVTLRIDGHTIPMSCCIIKPKGVKVLHYQWWHMDPNMVNSQMMYYYRRKPYKIRHRPPWDSFSRSSHLGTASISNHKNESKPNFQAIVSNAFEMNNIQDPNLKEALIKALEQAVDYDEIFKFVQEKMKSHVDVRLSPRSSPSTPEGSWLEPSQHEN